MASLNPARALRLEGRKGSIAAGMDADLVVLTPDLAVRETWVGGQVIYGR
jgi:N-acetylglucosamine-6-phosphate deacetylase